MKIEPSPEAQLAAFFDRNGYFRWPNSARREQENHQTYKKGYEVRLVARNQAELQQIRSLLVSAGFSVAKPYSQAKQWVQPVYGRQAVERFCQFCEIELDL